MSLTLFDLIITSSHRWITFLAVTAEYNNLINNQQTHTLKRCWFNVGSAFYVCWDRTYEYYTSKQVQRYVWPGVRKHKILQSSLSYNNIEKISTYNGPQVSEFFFLKESGNVLLALSGNPVKSISIAESANVKLSLSSD